MDEPPTQGYEITFESLGIPSVPLAETAFGKIRNISDLDKKEKVYSICSVLALMAVLVLTIYRLAVVNTNESDFTFALILLLNTVFCLYYVIHGVLRERPYEILMLSVAALAVWLYIILNYALGSKYPVKLARLVVVTVLSPVIIVLGVLIAKQYRDSGRLIFRTVGANTTLQEICQTAFMYFGLMKLDLQMGLTMVILIVTHANDVNTEDIVILSIGGTLTIVWFVIGYLSVRTENKYLSIPFFIGFIWEPVYVIYKIVKSAQEQNSKTDELAATTYACSTIDLLVHALVLILYIQVFKNFGKGLKQKVYAESAAMEQPNPEHVAENA